MAFLTNDGNIIIDAVLTDAGRARLAKNDGSFKISKFALVDDCINYGSYNKSHASGSAYFDLAILQTPILEAFTNNTSFGNSKLLTIARSNLLYLPVIKLNNTNGAYLTNKCGSHVVAVDKATEASYGGIQGVMLGESLNSSTIIRLDQGLDTSEISYSFTLDSDLVETQYILEIDNRLGKIISKDGVVARMSYLDDDNIASYYLSLGTNNNFVTDSDNANRNSNVNEVISGPRGTTLQFIIQSSLELNTSTYLFTQLGTTDTGTSVGGTVAIYYIDSYIKVSGATTGFQIEVPIRFIKNQ